MGKKKAPTAVATQTTPQRGLTTEDKTKVLRTRMQLARLLLSKDVPDILLPDLEKLMLAGNMTILRRTERAEESKIEISEITGEELEAEFTGEAESDEPDEAPPPGPRRGVRR